MTVLPAAPASTSMAVRQIQYQPDACMQGESSSRPFTWAVVITSSQVAGENP